MDLVCVYAILYYFSKVPLSVCSRKGASFCVLWELCFPNVCIYTFVIVVFHMCIRLSHAVQHIQVHYIYLTVGFLCVCVCVCVAVT